MPNNTLTGNRIPVALVNETSGADRVTTNPSRLTTSSNNSSSTPQNTAAGRTGISSIEGDLSGQTFDINSVLNSGLTSGVPGGDGSNAMASLSTASMANLKSVSSMLTGMINTGGYVGNVLTQTNSDALQARWTDFLTKASLEGGVMDVNALVQWVLRESYQETTQDLYFFAEKVKFFNAVKKAIRDEINSAREVLSNTEGDDSAALAFTGKGIEARFTGDGSVPAMSSSLYGGPAINTKGKLDTYIQNLEEKLSSVGDDAQLANVDLQNMLQKQQQTIQLLSNVSKMLHDTMLAIVRKIGG